MKTRKAHLVVMLALMATLSAFGKAPQKNQAAMGQVKHITQKEFVNLIADYEKTRWEYKGTKPAIVDFYANWCGPCRALSPVLEQVATEYKESIVVYKVDVDDEKELAAAFGIRSIPTLLFIPMKDNPQVVKGAMNKQELTKLVEKYLLK